MREIKFRGKIKEKGMSESWLEGSLVHITKTYKGEEDEQECDIYQIINEDGVGFFIDKDTIGQNTGLKDKNGKEIYEGDVIKYKLENHQTRELYYQNFVVAWNEETVSYVIKNDTKGILCMDYVPKSGEVIGNIYENPELLENKE